MRDHLWLSLVLLDGDGVRPVTPNDLEVMDLDAVTAWKLAEALLDRTSRTTDLRPVDTVDGLSFVVSGDGLAATRMTRLTHLLAPMPLGGIVAAVPSRDQLLVVTLDSARAIDALQVLAAALGHAAERAEEPLSDQLFWYDGRRWVPIAVVHATEDITVLPPPDFVRAMNHLAAMDLVSVAGEA
ncbi:MAG: hypothetical protein H6738_08030 [Alphaproteobacteria bacterium]|nr:hypothetical protein [Alphaproteobacteria bacterium]MCB9696712.1 hypothetical protein [Alphaproteobacteria bacterium]